MAYHHRPVRVAEDNLCAHVNEAVHKEQTALEHLLVNEHASLALGGHHQHHGQQVRREARPGGVGKGHDGAVQERVYLVALLRGNVNIVSLLLQLDAQAAERVRNNAQVIVRHVFDGEAALADGGHADKRAHLNHVRQNFVQGAVQRLHAMDAQQVGAHAVDIRTHAVEHLAKLLQVRLAGGVVDGGGAFGQHGGHHDVGRTGHGGFVQQHVSAYQAAFLREMERTARGVIVHPGTQLDHAVQVGVHPAPTDFVAAGLGEPGMAETAQQRPHDHHRAAELGAFLHEFLRLDVGGVHGIGLERVHALGQARHFNAHLLQQVDKILHIQDFRNVGDGYRLAGEQHGADHFQGLVLGALRGNAAGQLMSAFDDKFCHSVQIYSFLSDSRN